MNNCMSVFDLNREQLRLLKIKIYDDKVWNSESRRISSGEINFIDDLVDDEEVFNIYEGKIFTKDEFD